MQEKSIFSLIKMNRQQRVRSGFRQVITLLSLAVVLCVFWSLKLTGITMAGEAFCGMTEHVHGKDCGKGALL